jgi:hypothetical protein
LASADQLKKKDSLFPHAQEAKKAFEATRRRSRGRPYALDSSRTSSTLGFRQQDSVAQWRRPFDRLAENGDSGFARQASFLLARPGFRMHGWLLASSPSPTSEAWMASRLSPQRAAGRRISLFQVQGLEPRHQDGDPTGGGDLLLQPEKRDCLPSARTFIPRYSAVDA